MRNFKAFLRSFYITAVILLCLTFGFIGMARAYESMRQIGFGEYKSAVEADKDGLRIFDFRVEF